MVYISFDLSKYKGLIFDMDGVLWNGKRVIIGAPLILKTLREKGYKVSFASNSSGRSLESCYNKAKKLGFNINKEEIFIASREICSTLKNQLGAGAKIYLIGSSGLKEEVLNADLNIVNNSYENVGVDAVLVGWDNDFNSDKLRISLKLILDGAKLAVVNRDATTPGEDGLRPATGSIVAAVERMIGREADFMIGKPEVTLLEKANKKMGTSKEEIAIIGDTPDTDILAGNRYGIDTFLVLSGNTSRKDIDKIDKDKIKPNYIIKSVNSLLRSD
ncbi:MAG: HAD-IIA family hydrolase [bacterium]